MFLVELDMSCTMYVHVCIHVHCRWDDDVVFKNCAKSEPKNKVQLYMYTRCVHVI